MNKPSNAQANTKRVRQPARLGCWWDTRYPTRNIFKKEAGQGITEMVLLSAAVVSFAMGIVHYIGGLLGM